MIAGKIVAGYLADIVGRRWMYVFGGLSTAVFLPVIVLLHTPENIIVLLTIFGFLYGVPYGVNATYMTESFETQVRGTAVGGAYNIGRAGAAIAPALIGVIATDLLDRGRLDGDGRRLLPDRADPSIVHTGEDVRPPIDAPSRRHGTRKVIGRYLTHESLTHAVRPIHAHRSRASLASSSSIGSLPRIAHRATSRRYQAGKLR